MKDLHPSSHKTKAGCRRIPWWVFLLSAVIVYSLLKHMLPAVILIESKYYAAVGIGRHLAPIVAIALLILAANSLYQNESAKPEDPPDETSPHDQHDD